MMSLQSSDALVADEHRRTGDQLADLVLALAAERAIQELFRAVSPVPVRSSVFLHRLAVIDAQGETRPVWAPCDGNTRDLRFGRIQNHARGQPATAPAWIDRRRCRS